MELIYTQYQVTTKTNAIFGVTGGSTGTLHAFTCVAPDAGTAPRHKDFKGYYEMFEFIHTALNDKDGEGLQYLKDAFKRHSQK